MKKGVIILLASIMVLLTACSEIGGLGERFGFGSGSSTGGKGVALKFTEAPADPCPKGVSGNVCVLEGEPVTFKLEATNYVTGEKTVEGKLCLIDELTDNFGGIPTDTQCRSIVLQPANEIENKVIPTVAKESFGPYTYRNPQSELPISTTITGYFEYEVEATAGSTTCVKRQGAESPSIPSGCGSRQTLQVQQPDLPLQVTSLVSRAAVTSETEATVILDITLSKNKPGELLSLGAFASSSDQASARIKFEVFINLIPATCLNVVNNKLEIQRNQDQKIIKCSAKLALDQDHIQAPITINMGYRFKQSIEGPNIKVIKEEALIA